MPAPRRPTMSKDPCRFNRKKLILRFWQVIPATLAALERVVRRILQVARAMGCAQGELDKVELALREALANAILHGSRSDPTKKVSVCCLCEQDRGMLLVVRDYGPGFDPSKIPDPTRAKNIYSSHGRGLYLIRQLMDEVRFEKGGRQIVMKKQGRRARPGHRRRSP